MNYDKEMDKLISSFTHKPTLLLHACCAPCSSSVIERLAPHFDITILYYNPNIEPYEEYLKRKNELNEFLKVFNDKIKVIDADYDNDEYHKLVSGLEDTPERGPRCYLCYEKRLTYTYKKAKNENFEYFGTTLTLSPYKVSSWINEIGLKLEDENTKFLISDFKKQNGYKRSIELSKIYNLYRQDYCGCVYSRKKEQNFLQ